MPFCIADHQHSLGHQARPKLWFTADEIDSNSRGFLLFFNMANLKIHKNHRKSREAIFKIANPKNFTIIHVRFTTFNCSLSNGKGAEFRTGQLPFQKNNTLPFEFETYNPLNRRSTSPNSFISFSTFMGTYTPI